MTVVRPTPDVVDAGSVTRQSTDRSARLRIANLHWLWHPLTAICCVQAGLSLTLVWSNTAFADEAEYLWLGRTLLANWLHGTPWPHYERGISGSQVIYPPLGALVASLGGLAAARIMSLVFMLGATILLYLTASRIVGKAGALFAAALWAMSAPVVRLAFATFDPLSVLLTAVSAWLVVQALYRRRQVYLVGGAALALALANATAYSGIVIDPVVIGFAILVWRQQLPITRLLTWMAVLAGGCALIFVLIMTLAHSWVGVETISSRSAQDHQSYSLVLNDAWKYSGLVIAFAVIGAALALRTRERPVGLLVFLGTTALVVPLAQVLFKTGWALDKHLAYGIWFAVIAGGYGCAKLIDWLPEARPSIAVICCALALTYPAINGWESAWAIYHEWADSRPFVAALRPALTHSQGLIDAAVQVHIAEYYTTQGADVSRWSDVGLSLDPTRLPRRAWRAYYAAQLRRRDFGVIAMFYAATPPASTLTGGALRGLPGRRAYQDLVNSPAYDPDQPGLPALTRALEHDSRYRLVAEGPFATGQAGAQNAVFAIWERVARS